MLDNLAFGFVAICLSEHECSPAGTVTVKQAASLDPEPRATKILRVAKRNLENTLRIMWFLEAHDIELYRISANLIPLATHEVTAGWPWWEEPKLREIGAKIGRVAKAKGYRLSSHLPEVCGFTSEESFRWAREYLDYHERLYDLLGLDETAKIILHVGGAYKDKETAISVARSNLASLSPWQRRRVVLENDDRVFTVWDVVQLAGEAGVSVAFDWHHHWCNGALGQDPAAGAKAKHLPAPEHAVSEELAEALETAFGFWTDRPPKVHLSSPRDESKPLAHADYVDPRFVRPFLELLGEVRSDPVDAMIEAKKKDLALFELRKQLGI